MVSIIVIALSLASGNGASDTIKSHTVTTQRVNGDYVVHYMGAKSTHAPVRNAAHFAADEGANGVYPMVVAKRF